MPATDLKGPCSYGIPSGPCGNPEVRPYREGPRCGSHAPWARAGQPEPITPTEAARRKEQQ